MRTSISMPGGQFGVKRMGRSEDGTFLIPQWLKITM